MRILVCGGRDFTDKAFVYRILYDFIINHGLTFDLDVFGPIYDWCKITIISGGAKGVDTFAINFSESYGTKLEIYMADWEKYPKAAGPIRNQQMLDEAKPNIVIAFPGGKGTANMIRRARKAGVEIREVEYKDSGG